MTSFCSLFVSLAVLLVSLPVTIGLRASSGRVSIMPVIVSASPTIIIAGSSMLVRLVRSLSASFASVGVLCLGTGGALPLGTSNSQVVTFSELLDVADDKFVDRLTRLVVTVTLAVGFSERFTELSATLGDVLRGGNGGADIF